MIMFTAGYAAGLAVTMLIITKSATRKRRQAERDRMNEEGL